MKYIDYFALPKFGHDSDALYKARLLVGILLAYLGQIFFYLLFLVFAADLPTSAVAGGGALLVGMFFYFVYALHDLRVRGNYTFSTHSIVAVTVVGVAGGVYISGGPVTTAANGIIVMPAILAFCLLGLQAGLSWTLVIFLITVTGIGFDYAGHEYIQVAPLEMERNIRAFNWVLAFAAVIAIVIIYEQMNSRLKKQLADERQRYKSAAQVATESSVVTKSADSMAQAGQELLASVIQQKTAIEQLATTSEELGATAEQNTKIAAEAKTAVLDTEQHLVVSKEDINKLVDSINQISQSSEEIQSFNNVINDISYQTNILSLNAMIEASRSSDSSGGFKVVAMEVKKLAERSANAAEDINKLLESNRNQVAQGVNLSETMQKRFDEISEKIVPLSDNIQNVSDASYEQNEAIQQIMVGLNEIDRAIENNKTLAINTADTATELKSNADSLMQVIESLDLDLEDE